jgi:hypothetical protein
LGCLRRRPGPCYCSDSVSSQVSAVNSYDLRNGQMIDFE